MIRFRMIKINTEQFAILKESMTSKDFGVSLSVDLKYAKEQRMIAVGAMFSFLSNEEQFMLLKVFCEFEINSDDWKELTDKDGVTIIPKNTLDFLITQTVGVARGVLHCKTEGTSFNNVVLPPINVTQMITNPLVINPS